ncbi:thioredoxin [bacterium]|nr:thioredoxin [bacterium]
MKVLKFGATWCPGCVVMKPMWEKIEEEVSELETEFFDADQNKDVLEKYNVKDLPTFIFLNKEGEEFLRLQGILNEDSLKETIKENLDK